MPEVVVLGVAQDGGVPHAGCLCANCEAARRDPARAHLPVSLGIRSGNRFAMIDATHAFEAQHTMLWRTTPASETHAGERFPAPEAVLITHAHTGHYTGLWQLDRSVLAAQGTSVIAPPMTARLLGENEPWQTMQQAGFISIVARQYEQRFDLLPGVAVELIRVPHRAEWATDTVAVAVRGPERRVLYLPDIDSWDAWDLDLVETVRQFDVVLLDGCFWEAPPRKGVPHPPITETLDLLQAVVDAGDVDVWFTHLNHSNPVLSPGSPEHRSVIERGFTIANEGDRISL